MTGNIPGNPTMPLHYVEVAGHEFHQRIPGIIAYTAMNSRGLREFRRFCEHYAMAIVVWSGSEREVIVCQRGMNWNEFTSVCGIGAWEVLGTAENLDRLTRNVGVVNWHEPIACSVHVRGSGAGREKIVAAKKFADPEVGEWTELQIAYREAVRDGELKKATDLLLKLARNKKEKA